MPVPDLRFALLVGDDIIAQDLGQQPADATYFGIVTVADGQLQCRFGIGHQHFELGGPLLRVRPVDVGLAILIDIALD